MVEFALIAIQLAVLAVLLVRRDPAFYLGRRFLLIVGTVGWTTGVLVESLPFTSVGHGIGYLTVLWGVLGLFAMRLFARLAGLWADAVRRDELEPDEKPQRMVHPVVAFGLLLSGIPMAFNLIAIRHEALEVARTPRDAETGVITGAEAIDLEPEDATDHAVLLVHGFMGTRTDFGRLPARLRDAGLHVRMMRLPGHGTRPSDLAEVRPDDYLAAVAEEIAKLAEEHDRVSLVGFSIGGALAATLAPGLTLEGPNGEVSWESPAVHRLVLVNPYLGELWRPEWLPGTTHGWAAQLAPLVPFVMRDERFIRVNRKEGLEGHLAYLTVSLEAVGAIEGLGSTPTGTAPEIRCPTLLLLSETDRVTPSAHGDALFGLLTGLPDADKRVVHYPRSDHILLRDHDREAAADAAVAWLTGD